MAQHSFTSWLSWSLVAAFAIYGIGLGIGYYGDDFQFLFDAPESKVFYYFTHNNPDNNFYRPIQSAFLALVQVAFGEATWPIQLVQLLAHLGLAALVGVASLRLGSSHAEAGLATAFMALSQANVGAVFSNDTFSQVTGTLFGCLFLWFLYLHFQTDRGGLQQPGNASARRSYAWGLALLALALWSKETSLAFVPLSLGLVLLGSWLRGRDRWVSSFLLRSAPIVVLTVLYFLIRSAVVPSRPKFGPESSFHIGSNLFVNLAQFGFGASVPASTVSAYSALVRREWLASTLYVAATLLFLTLVAVGLWRRDRGHLVRVGVFSAGAFVALYPTGLLRSVSEVYLYNSMPFVAALVGLGLGGLLARSQGSARWVAVGALLALLVSHGWAVHTKINQMQRTADRAYELAGGIVPFVDGVPREGRLLLLNPPTEQVNYSIFLMQGFNPLRRGLMRLNQLTGRQDFAADIIEHEELPERVSGGRCVVLTLSGQQIGPYPDGQRLCRTRETQQLAPLDEL